MTAAPKNASPACPYCKGTIAADLLRAGGNCPHCMLEIPGEEAPTDPGLEQKKKIAEVNLALERRRKRNRRALLALLVVLLVVASGVGYQQMKAAEAELVYELEDVYMAPREGMITVRSTPAGTTPPTPTAVSGGGTKPVRPRDLGLPDPGKVSDIQTAGVQAGSADATVKFVPSGSGTADATVGASGGGPGRSSLGEVAIAVKRTNTLVLESDEEILAMAKEVTSAYAPQIETCVAARLKADPTFQGAWKVNFTIMPDGTVGKLSAKALEAADSEVEACIKRKIATWGFQKISHEFKVGKTYRFSGSDW